jgi:hypothetical protein
MWAESDSRRNEHRPDEPPFAEPAVTRLVRLASVAERAVRVDVAGEQLEPGRV